MKVGAVMHDWSDFTEESYIKLLKLAKQFYKFVSYNDDLDDDNIVLWRHDVDFSVHRGLRLAEIENSLGVHSTFFLLLSSSSYNLFEKNIRERVKKIIDLGHNIGLHFDPSLYSKDDFYDKLAWEKRILEEMFEVEVKCFSFHNPDVGGCLSIDAMRIAGMVNAYSGYLKNNFKYCSDSNGYWRFDSIESILLKDGKYPRLQILTHPEWWTQEAIPPRQRIQRCINGRRDNAIDEYDSFMISYGRENIAN